MTFENLTSKNDDHVRNSPHLALVSILDNAVEKCSKILYLLRLK